LEKDIDQILNEYIGSKEEYESQTYSIGQDMLSPNDIARVMQLIGAYSTKQGDNDVLEAQFHNELVSNFFKLDVYQAEVGQIKVSALAETLKILANPFEPIDLKV
jgi:hypothetical protein